MSLFQEIVQHHYYPEILNHPTKGSRNVGRPSMEWGKVKWGERQRWLQGRRDEKRPPPLRLERVRTASGMQQQQQQRGGGPTCKIFKMLRQRRLHWGDTTEPGWAVSQWRAPTELISQSSSVWYSQPGPPTGDRAVLIAISEILITCT